MVTKEKIKYDVKYLKIDKWNRLPNVKYRHMECRECGMMTEVGEDATAVTCYICVSNASEPPSFSTKKKSDKPPGWHFMKVYVHKDGTVYHKGEEQPKLKGTLPVTVIKKKKEGVKLNKFQKQNMRNKIHVEIHTLKKKLKKAKFKKDIKSINVSINKLQRQLKKLN
tara:strand:+ start:400 stop:900 length:501 start_codon:yes stop_codon:yes gene_type:complete